MSRGRGCPVSRNPVKSRRSGDVVKREPCLCCRPPKGPVGLLPGPRGVGYWEGVGYIGGELQV